MGGYGNFSGPKSSQRYHRGRAGGEERRSAAASSYAAGERVFHQKFGYGKITGIDGNKLTIDFDKAGSKRVLDSFVERH